MRLNSPVSNHEFVLPSDLALISVTDLKGRITYCNAAFVNVSGYAADELLGQPHNLIRHPDMPAEAFRDMWATIESGRPWSGVVKNRRKNGDHYWVKANAIPIRKTNGEAVGYISVRTCPARAEVAAAEQLYAEMRAQLAQGALRIRVHRGDVVRLNARGWMARLRPAWLDQHALVPFVLGWACLMAALWLPLPWAVLLSLPLVLGAAYVNHRLLRHQLAPIVDAAVSMASGDLVREIPHKPTDLFAELRQALHHMKVSLKTIADDTNHEIANLRGAIQEIAAGNVDLSARTEEQASGLEQTAASAEQINGTTQHAAASVLRAAALAHQMSAQAQKSQSAVQRVAASMTEIDQSAGRVGDIIHVIEGVAFQTNILALNAAVEAARAGDAGRGFAVVATEVRALAQRTAEAAREIRTLIGESSLRVAAGNAETLAAAQLMSEAVASVDEVASLLTELSHAASEQQGGIAQITEAVTHMDHITQQNAAMVEQLTSASDSLHEQVTQAGTILALLRVRPQDRSLAEQDAVALRQAYKAEKTL